MKRLFLFALVIVLMFCGCAAPASTSNADAEASPNVDMVEKVKLDEANQKISELETEIDGLKQQLQSSQDEIASYKDQIKAYAEEKAAREHGVVAPIDKGVQLYDDEYVTISYLGCEKDSIDWTQVVLLVQNKTDYTLTFQSSAMAFDGLGLGYPSGSDDVAPQSKGKVYFHFEEEPETMNPSTFTATIKVIDFSKQMTGNQSYEVTVVNVDVSSANG